MNRPAFLLLTLLSLLPAVPAAAQSARHEAPPPACEHGRISALFIDNHSIFDTTDPKVDRRLVRMYRIANALHVRTRESVIRRELLFRPGDCYAPRLLSESERLLRANGYLARVDVYPLLQPDSSYHVVVDTRDEWSTRVDLGLSFERGLGLERLSLTEANFLGTGRAVELFYIRRDANRDYGIGYHTRQLASSRWTLDAAVGRTRRGTFASQSLAYPFREEGGRWGAQQTFRRYDRTFDFALDHEGTEHHVLVPLYSQAFELALVRRLGRPGHLTTLGAAFSTVELDYPGGIAAAELIEGGRFGDPLPADTPWTRPLEGRLTPLRTARVLALLGQRNITWVKRRGLDALQGAQDIRIGWEGELAVGRSLPGRKDDRNLFTAASLYGALDRGPLLLAGRVLGDARRVLGAPPAARWVDLLVDGEALAYWRPVEHHTVVGRAAATGGWNTMTPFQLTLGGELGVRGYGRERFPGGKRLLFSLEDRIYFGGPYRDVLDLGGTLFLDVGRVGAGDAPYGASSGWRGAAGLGLRGAFPAGGRTTYRADLALPLERGAGLRDLRLIISVGELLGLSPRVRRARPEDFRPLPPGGAPFHFPQ
jgi:hypothetical protein